MKHLNASCKFCGAKLTLHTDDGYDEISDCFKLIPMAACNRCADLRVRRRVLNGALMRLAGMIQFDRSQETLESARKGFAALTQKYVQLVSDWTCNKELVWDEGIVEAILKDSTQIGDVLGRIWPAKQQPVLL